MAAPRPGAGLVHLAAAAVVVVAGLGLSLAGAHRAYRAELTHLQEHFTSLARDRIQALRLTLAGNLLPVEALGSLYRTMESVSQRHFRHFSHGLLAGRAGIRALEWAPRVPAARRSAFEAEQSGRYVGDFRITERGPDGALRPAGQRPDHFPVTFVEPRAGNAPVIGFDLASEPARRELLLRARDTGRLAVSGRVTPIQGSGEQYGFLAALPLYGSGALPDDPERRRARLTGFALGVYRIGDIVAATHPAAASPTMEGHSVPALRLRLIDRSAADDDRLLYPRGAGGAPATDFRITETIDVGGRTWQAIAHPATPFDARHGLVLGGGVLVGGILVTGLLAGLLLLAGHRARETRTWADSLMASEGRLRLFRAVVDESTDAIFVVDPETGRFLDVNAAASRVLGYSSEELLAMRVTDVEETLPDDTAWRDHVRQLDQTPERRVIMSGSHRRKDGSRFPVEVGISRVAVDGHAVILSQARDISQRQAAEEQQRALETQLFQAQKTEALGTMTGGIAHEFNNMLLPILSLAGLALRDLPDGDRNRRRLEKVVEAATRAKGLVEQLLRFTGRQTAPDTEADLDIVAAVGEVTAFLHTLIPSSIEQRVAVEPIPRRVRIGRDDLRTVLLNLVGNATDAMAGKAGVLGIQLRALAPPAGLRRRFTALGEVCARLTVTDTGCGMPPEVQERIFDPFFTTKDVGEGVGLGMFAVHRIVTRAGGAIEIDSTPDRGTTIHIYLPLTADDGTPGTNS